MIAAGEISFMLSRNAHNRVYHEVFLFFFERGCLFRQFAKCQGFTKVIRLVRERPFLADVMYEARTCFKDIPTFYVKING